MGWAQKAALGLGQFETGLSVVRHNEGSGDGDAPLQHRCAGRPSSLEHTRRLQQSRAKQLHHQQQQPHQKYWPQNQQDLLALEQWTSQKQHGGPEVSFEFQKHPTYFAKSTQH